MDLEYTPYMVPLLVASLITGYIGTISWRKRQTSGMGAAWASLFSIGATLWCFGYAFELAGSSEATKLFWAKVQYIGIVSIPVCLFAFSLVYTDLWRWPTYYFLILFIIPVVTLILVWLEPSTGIIWQAFRLDDTGPFLALDFIRYGAGFWINWVYAYVMLSLGTYILVRAIRRYPKPYQAQVRTLLLAVTFPWIGNAFYILDLVPVPNLDLTPVSFAITAVLLWHSLTRLQLLDITPIARYLILENIGDAVLVFDKLHYLVDLNPAADKLLNIPQMFAIGRSVRQLLSKEWQPLFDFYQSHQMKAEVHLPDVRTGHYFQLQKNVIYNHRQKENGYILTLRDVSEQKQAQIALAQQKQLFENLVSVGHTLIEQVELKETLARVLHIAVEITTSVYGSLSLFDEREQIITILHTEAANDQTATIMTQPTEATGLTGWVAQHRQATLIDDISQDERWQPLLAHHESAQSALSVPILQEGRLLGILTLAHTAVNHYTRESLIMMVAAADQMALGMRNAQMYEAQQQLVTELREAKEYAEMANRAKSAFLATVSHELRTPLTAILGYNEILQEQVAALGHEALLPRFDKIQLSAKHLAGMINDIIDLTHLESGKIRLNRSIVAVEALVEMVVLVANQRFAKAENSFEVQCEPNLGFIQADPRRLQRILIHLLDNAMKFTKAGKVILRVSRYRDDDACEWLQFCVIDTGIGMTPDFVNKLFQQFTQADSSSTRQYGGLGIGLTLSRQFCQLMNGRITVKSQLGQGTTFTVQLPANYNEELTNVFISDFAE